MRSMSGQQNLHLTNRQDIIFLNHAVHVRKARVTWAAGWLWPPPRLHQHREPGKRSVTDGWARLDSLYGPTWFVSGRAGRGSRDCAVGQESRGEERLAEIASIDRPWTNSGGRIEKGVSHSPPLFCAISLIFCATRCEQFVSGRR